MYYKKKARVRKVENEFWAEIQELGSRDILKIHQIHLRCVVPVILAHIEHRKRGLGGQTGRTPKIYGSPQVFRYED